MSGLNFAKRFRLLVDWNDDGIFEPDQIASAIQYPNLIADARNMAASTHEVSGSASLVTGALQAEVTAYGEKVAEVQTGTDVDAGYRVTFNGMSLWDVEPCQAYSFTCWVYADQEIDWDIFMHLQEEWGDHYTPLNSEVWQTVTIPANAWTQVNYVFATPPDLTQHAVGITLQKSNDATNVNVKITGWMVVLQNTSYRVNNLWSKEAYEGENHYTSGPVEVDVSYPFSDKILQLPVTSGAGTAEMYFGFDTQVNYFYPVPDNTGSYWVEWWGWHPTIAGFGTGNFLMAGGINISEYFPDPQQAEAWRRYTMTIKGFGAGTAFSMLIRDMAYGSFISMPRCYTFDNGFLNTELDKSLPGSPYGGGGELPLDGNGTYLLAFNWTPGDTRNIIVRDITGTTTYVDFNSGAAAIDQEHFFCMFEVTNGDTGLTLLNAPALNNLRLMKVSTIGDYATPTFPSAWNAGGGNRDGLGYDDITEYVQAVRCNSGLGSFNNSLANEGQMTVTLDNQSRLFSPSYSGSPLYNKLRQNIKVQLQILEDDAWVPVWSGWTHTWEVEPGAKQRRTATLTARQGFFRLQQGEFLGGHFTDTDVPTVVKELIRQSGFYSLSNSQQAFINSARLGVNTYLRSADSLFSSVDAAINTYDMIGEQWNRKTPIRTALEETLETEGGKLYMLRDGSLVYRNREYFVDTTGNIEIDLDSEAPSTVQYTRGQDVVNRVEVIVTPKKETTDAIVWVSRGAVELKRGRRGDWVKKVIPIDFQFEEGTGKTITRIAGFDEQSTFSVTYSQTKNRTTVYRPMPQKDVDQYVKVSIISTPEGESALLLENGSRNTIYITVTLYGDYVEGGETETYVFEDLPAIEEAKQVLKETVTLRTAVTEEEAQSIAADYLLRRARPYPEFSRLGYTIRDEIALGYLLNRQVGTKLNITESQTGETSLPHVIVGEDIEIFAGEVRVSWTLAAMDTRDYAQISDTVSPLGTYIYI